MKWTLFRIFNTREFMYFRILLNRYSHWIVNIGAILACFVPLVILLHFFSPLSSDTPQNVEAIFAGIQAIALILAAIFIVIQLRDTKKVASADFISNLNSAFVRNKDFVKLYDILYKCQTGTCGRCGSVPFNITDKKTYCKLMDPPTESDPTKPDPPKSDPTKPDPTESEPTKSDSTKSDSTESDKLIITIALLANYLTFFETIYLLKNDNVISFKYFDNLFAYRFFLAVHSKLFQQAILYPRQRNFKEIFCLEYEWLKYRESRNILGELTICKAPNYVSLEEYLPLEKITDSSYRYKKLILDCIEE
jgi:hypothetical protein